MTTIKSGINAAINTAINTGIKRWLLRVLTVVVALPTLFFCAALIGAVLPGQKADLPVAAEQLVGLVRGPLHFDFLLPATPEIRTRFGFAEADGVPINDPNVEWIVVGWGARGFYTQTATLADIGAGPVFKAVTGDGAVMHIDVSGHLSGVEAAQFVPMSSAQLRGLLGFVDASFLRDQAGQPFVLEAHFNQHDAFYQARGQFNILNTCNVWVGRALRAAGVRFGAWTPTPQAVVLSLRWFS